MISIIVPIYNVEEYLPQCLDSLTNLSYRDVEFVLIDDGSTDKSGEIAEKYAADSRFRVYHIKNNGLAAARNFGIEKASGNWVMFADSDDWVSHDFCSIPYHVAESTDADLVIFRACAVKNGRKMFRKVRKDRPEGIVAKEDALIYGGNAPWNKLYKRELFKTIRYPEGRVFEDIATTYKTVCIADRIVMIPDILYYHVYRKKSISHICSVKNRRDAFVAALQRSEDLKAYGYNVEAYESLLVSESLGLLGVSYPSDEPLYQKAAVIADTVKGFPPGMRRKKHLMLMAWKTDHNLFHFICYVLGKKDPELNHRAFLVSVFNNSD